MPFKDQVIWVTGASSGIGEALAVALSRRGARLVLSARRESELERVRALCEQPERHLCLPLDLEQPEQFAEAAARVEAACGRIDCLINNAGISQRAYAMDSTLAVDRRLMAVNFFAPVALAKAVLPGMLARGRGQLVCITSLVGHIATPKRSGYSASKHAVHGYFDALRAELHDKGIKVTLICPGFIKTNLSYAALEGDGSPHNILDDAQATGYPATRCAEDIVAGLAKGRDEFLVGGKECYAVYLQRFFPGLFRKLIRRVKVV